VQSLFFGFVSRMNCGDGHGDGDGIFAGGQGSQPKSERGHVGTWRAGSGRKKLAGELRVETSSAPENPSNYRRLGGNWRERMLPWSIRRKQQLLLSIVSQE
jgi:hypothetical protein